MYDMKNKCKYLLLLFAIVCISTKAENNAVLPHEKPVAVALSSDAPTAVQSAAKDLVAALNKVFPDDDFVLKSGSDVKDARRIEIVVDGQGAFESFRIAKNGQSLRISGADPLGAVYGIYALLEYYGCGFYLTYDTYPALEKGLWRNIEQDFADEPLIRERYSFNWHNFLSGCSSWDLPQWKMWIDQCRKLRYNIIMVHVYANNPMFTFRFNGIEKPVGWLASTAQGRDWGTAHVNDVRRMFGGEYFDGPVYAAPPALLSGDRQTKAVQSMMKQVFAYAKAQGLKVAFQLDIDTDQSNPDEMLALLPENAKIKADSVFRPNPETPEGKAFYKAIFDNIMSLYPEINPLVICHRSDPAQETGNSWKPRRFDLETFPNSWQKEYNDLKNRQDWEDPNRLAGYVWIGKVMKTFQELARESGRRGLVISQASWGLKHWIPYADACSPKDIAFIPLDANEAHSLPEIDDPEELSYWRGFAETGRRIIPIIWSHHDDMTYIGRTHTPFPNFASLLEQGGFDSYGIIHWLLRPHGLYFKSHSVQVWQSTKNQPLEETCRTMALHIFGKGNETVGGEYLFDWINNAPNFGRDTWQWMIDLPFKPEACNSFRLGGERRKALLDKITVSQNEPSAINHPAYWKGVEDFNIRFRTDETALQQSVAALKAGNIAEAKAFIEKTDPVSTIKKYAAYTSTLGMTRGDLGILVLMNLKWYPSFIGQRQLLGYEDYRIDFAPTVHEPMAQAPGIRSFHIDRDDKLWLTQGEKEMGGKQWTSMKIKAQGLSESEKEIVCNGLAWTEPVRLPILPAMLSHFAPKDLQSRMDGKCKLRLYVADPLVKKTGDAEFDVILYCGSSEKLVGTIVPKPNMAEIYEYDIPENYTQNIVLGIQPKKGRASLCGIVAGK
jgi:hypothetical protein